MMRVGLVVSRLPGGSLKWELPFAQCEFGSNSETVGVRSRIVSFSVLKLERLHCTRRRRPRP